ncbi:MAG: sensor histidine kinase [Maricaulaceae bacterium]
MGLNFLRTTTFRLTLLASILFSLSALALLAYIYISTVGALTRQTDRVLSVEMDTLVRIYRSGGVGALNKAIVQRQVGAAPYLYYFALSDGSPISGNVNALPENANLNEDRLRFEYRSPDPETGDFELREAMGLVETLPSGHVIMVGRDITEQAHFARGATDSVLIAASLVLGLGLISGAVVSQRFASRLEMLNTVARDVQAGDFSRRAPRNGSGDELDALAGNLNAMLERIELLMSSMRHAGDALAHDLRSPLTRMRNRLEAAARDTSGSIDKEEALGSAIQDADDLLNTFNAVLRIARLEAGERRDQLRPMDPCEVLSDLCEMYDPVCEEAGLEFSYDCAEGLSVLADRGFLAQAVANVLDNAVKYTPEGGAVALRLRRCASGEVEISVTDTGPGIPADQRERVKKRFVRLDGSLSKPGAGLGLSLVQAVAEIHGGRFELSDGPGALEGYGPGLRAALILPSVK